MDEKAAKASLCEKKNWDRYFAEALEGRGQEHTNPLWWSLVDRDVNRIIQNLFTDRDSISVLEAGAGSGGTSFDLARYIKISSLCLVDISSQALAFAKSLTPSLLVNKTQYLEQDLLDLELDTVFDLVWNIGVIEHYPLQDIQKMVKRLFCHVKPGGYLVLGIPNRNSIPVIKAAFLGSKLGRCFLPFPLGYRNTTEILYSNRRIRCLIEDSIEQPVQLQYAGSVLWVGAPESIVRMFHRCIRPNCFSFLSLFIVRKL